MIRAYRYHDASPIVAWVRAVAYRLLAWCDKHRVYEEVDPRTGASLGQWRVKMHRWEE